jgi:predicted RNA-binding protein YlqC (UPF0109 family)
MDSKIYKDILGYIVDYLVEDPDAVTIDIQESPGAVTLRLRVGAGDMGKVIGRGGRIAKEIRALLRAAGARENKRVLMDILD